MAKNSPRWLFLVAHSMNEKYGSEQIVFFAESRRTVKLKLFLEKAKKGHSGEFLDIDRAMSRDAVLGWYEVRTTNSYPQP